eukprot:192494_1
MLLKTIQIQLSTDYMLRFDYVLRILQILNHKINQPEEFFSRIGCIITKNDFASIRHSKLVYESTPYPNKIVLQRLYEELKITELSNEYQLLTTKLQNQVYPIFNCLSLSSEFFDSKFIDTEYKIVDEDEKNDMLFKYQQPIVIKHDNMWQRSYQILVKNTSLFGTDKYFLLQTLNQTIFANCKDFDFSKMLQIKDDKLIIFNQTQNHQIKKQQPPV